MNSDLTVRRRENPNSRELCSDWNMKNGLIPNYGFSCSIGELAIGIKTEGCGASPNFMGAINH